MTLGAVSGTKMWLVFLFFDVMYICLFGKHHLKYWNHGNVRGQPPIATHPPGDKTLPRDCNHHHPLIRLYWPDFQRRVAFGGGTLRFPFAPMKPGQELLSPCSAGVSLSLGDAISPSIHSIHQRSAIEITHTKTSIAPKKGPFQTEFSSSNHWFSGGKVSFRGITIHFGGIKLDATTPVHDLHTSEGPFSKGVKTTLVGENQGSEDL